MTTDDIPRVSLSAFPTPVEAMPNLSKHLGGPNCHVKRDDATTLGLAGNKTRKLEFLIADALSVGADTLITTGGLQSNHCRLTAAAAAKFGLTCDLVLGVTEKPTDQPNGNLLLDRLLGANLHFSAPHERIRTTEDLAKRLREEGRNPYVIPLGGSNGLGAVGYVRAMEELLGQLHQMECRIDHIVFPTSSGGTQAEIQGGAELVQLKGQLHGISIDQTSTGGFPESVEQIREDATVRLGIEVNRTSCGFSFHTDYLGGGYGVVGELEQNAIGLAASKENVLFWHTGGVPALFAYSDQIVG